MRQFKAPRGGAARSARPRSSTADWVRAALHAAHGYQGGVWRMGIRVIIMVSMGLVWVRLIMLPFIVSAVTPSASGSVDRSSPGGELPAWVARFVATDSAGSELLTVFLCGLGLAVMSCMGSAVPWMGVQFPIARSRLAWVVWMRTQLEECAYLVCAMTTLACIAVVLSYFAGEAAWMVVVQWMKGMIAMFALLPLARVLRMILIRSVDPFADPWRMRGPVALPALCGFMVCMATLMLGTKLAMVGWDEAMLHLRAEMPLDLRPWTILLAVPPILLLRWLWLRILVRHFRTCDLNLG